jgi:transposase
MNDRDPIYTRPVRHHEEFIIFERSLRKLMSEGLKFDMSHPSLEDRRLAEKSFKRRLCSLIVRDYMDKVVLKLVKFFSQHFEEIFTFVRVPGVPWHNNGAERDLRPSVVIRKNAYGSRSLLGAKAFETLMTLFMTCKKREVNFVVWL